MTIWSGRTRRTKRSTKINTRNLTPDIFTCINNFSRVGGGGSPLDTSLTRTTYAYSFMMCYLQMTVIARCYYYNTRVIRHGRGCMDHGRALPHVSPAADERAAGLLRFHGYGGRTGAGWRCQDNSRRRRRRRRYRRLRWPRLRDHYISRHANRRVIGHL